MQNDTIQQVAVRVPLDEILEQASAGSEEKAAEFLEQVEGLPLEGFSSVDAMKIGTIISPWLEVLTEGLSTSQAQKVCTSEFHSHSCVLLL